MITLNAIRSRCSAPAYTRGNQVYKGGKVGDWRSEEDRDRIWIKAEVEGSYGNQYAVSITYHKKKDSIEDYQCECEAYYTYSGMCKHCVAVALELYYGEKKDSQELSGKGGKKPGKIRAQATDEVLANIIYASSMKEKARYLQPDLTGKVELIPSFERLNNRWSVEFKIGSSQKYVVKNISRLIEAMEQNEWVEYGKKLAFFHERSVFTPVSQKLLALIEQYITSEKNVLSAYYGHSRYSYCSYMESLTKRNMALTEEWMVEFSKVLLGERCEAVIAGSSKELEFVEGDPVLKVQVQSKADGGYKLVLPAAETFLGRQGICVREGGRVYVCSREFSEKMEAIGSLFQGKKAEYSIHPKDANAFCASVLLALKQCTRCQVDEGLEKYEPQPCRIAVYLDRQDKEITAKAVCSYGDTSYNLLEDITVSEMHRDFEKEYGLNQALCQLFPIVNPKRELFVLSEDDDDGVYRLVGEGIPKLQQMGDVLVSDSLKRLQLMQKPKVRVGIAIKAGLLDIDLNAEQIPLEEIESILQCYRRKRKFYRLADGSFLQLEDNALSAVAELAEGLELKGKQLAEGHLALPGYRAFYLDQILRENEGDIRVDREPKFKALLREMKNVEDSDFEEPEGLAAELRPYQRFGYRWMMTLAKLGFGGILADDMGLGKTVQTIAYFLGQKERLGEGKEERLGEREEERPGEGKEEGLGKGKEEEPGEEKGGMENPGMQTGKREYLGLVVCPASLVYNWESEIQRFAPFLSAVTVTGTAEARREKIRQGEGDILLTSYDLLKRDTEQYKDVRFGTVVIDEAQNIKNYTTQAAKSVKALEGTKRFALTGTPIENSLSELWSIFDFLMPGILSSNKKFRESYEAPIVSNQDERAAARLKKMIRPYILRRVKTEVLKELPDKIEKLIYSRMGDEQKKIYDATLQKLLDSLSRQSQEEFKTGKLQILAELTKLRQLCCDPAMVYENYQGEAAKVETCMDLIRSGVAGENQVLVFSQFTTALSIIGKRLAQEGIPCYTLTGATSKEKRAKLVADFNQDKTPVFLISLKAGGTGLNLTAASIVIHFDPWWNMAAQNQATDRAHRIGQRQVVTVYKLLMKDTLEEKIQKLQEQKAQLSDEIISEGSIRDTLATKEELLEILRN